ASAAALALVRTEPQRLRATVGVHPHHAAQIDDGGWDELAALAADEHCSAIGECGLDYFRLFAPAAQQQAAFERQLELASRRGKPVFLHQRDAHGDFVAILRRYRPRLAGGVAHCFTGDGAQLRDYLDLGLHIGITGWICDERRGQHLRDVVRQIPAGWLMLETDGPYLLPRDLRPPPAGRRNEPAFLPHIAATVAAARRESIAELAAHTTAAARRLFALPELPDQEVCR
ncbi:MAG: TatD family hydrolase, partial [Steroidobacteraceae bacterium]|nr:TatD family hydrolase [Steroidobacteraceae bacterium]